MWTDVFAVKQKEQFHAEHSDAALVTRGPAPDPRVRSFLSVRWINVAANSGCHEQHDVHKLTLTSTGRAEYLR